MIMNEEKQLQKQIDRIKDELYRLGPMRPGSISKQYNICGSPNCRCKDPVNPKKHGPYYQLSYTWRGKSTSEFVKEELLSETQEQVANYKRFKELTQELVDRSVEIARLRKKQKK